MSDELAAIQEQTFPTATKATADSYPPERRLTGHELAAYLDRRAFAVIGSCRPDGRPHAAISSYIRQGRQFWLPAVAGSVRERNTRTHLWLTMTITESAMRTQRAGPVRAASRR
jgi:pyridoxamine 5'-phosphate oxidase-like protein